MSTKILGILYTVLSAVSAALAAVPYSWAHWAAGVVMALLALIHGGTVVANIATQKAIASQGKAQQ